MKAVVVEVEGERQVESGVLRGACLECGADVPYIRTAPEGVAVPVACPDCLFEAELTRLGPGRAAVRRPYGCRRFAAVSSSNLAAVGARGPYLVVRFRSGAAYRYRGASHLLGDLLSARSPGREFHRLLRGKFETERLCARYGCFRPAARDRSQPLCRECLRRSPHRE